MSEAVVPRSIKFDPGLEGLRGLACLLVLGAHLAVEGIDPHFKLANFWGKNLLIAREAVLIFFLISGYVIGLVYQQDWSPGGRRAFLWKRFLRLVPLYWLAVLVSVLVYPIDSAGTIIGQLFFLQNTEPYPGFRLSVLKANYNLWSLNYEALYYLTFLLVWRLRPSARTLGWIIGGLIVIGFTGRIFPHQPKILSGYAVGGAFWYAGLWLVWYGKSHASDQGRRLPWISILLLLVVTPHLGALNLFMTGLGFHWPSDPDFPFISMRELQVLPIGLIILAGATRRHLPMPRLIWMLALLQPIAFAVWYAGTRNMPVLHEQAFILALFAVAICTLSVCFSEYWLTWLAPVGLISYGIYIFARPAQYFIFHHFAQLSGTGWTFAVRVLAALALALLAGYVMERIVHPRIRRWLRGTFEKKVVGAPVKLGPAD